MTGTSSCLLSQEFRADDPENSKLESDLGEVKLSRLFGSGVVLELLATCCVVALKGFGDVNMLLLFPPLD